MTVILPSRCHTSSDVFCVVIEIKQLMVWARCIIGDEG